MRPGGATRAGTQAPPLPISVIFYHAILHKQDNHLHTIHPKRRQPPTRNLPKRNRRGGACVPARTFAQRRFHTKNTRIMCGEFNDGCALVGRHGRAHRHRPYLPPSYLSTQSHTNKIPPTRNPPNETVGAVPMCPPERPRSGVSIPRIHALCTRI